MAKLRDFDAGDQTASNTGKQLHNLISKATIIAINERAGNPTHAMVIAVQGATAALHLVARCTLSRGDFEKETPLSSAHVLFAALLAYHACPFEKSYGNSTLEFSPLVMSDAMRDFQKMTGQSVAEYVNPDMVKAVQEFNSDQEMQRDLAQRRAMELGQLEGHSLN